jgi:hypothetical protein
MEVVHARAIQRRGGGGDARGRDVVGVDEIGGAAPADLVRPPEHRRLHGEGGIRGEAEVAAGAVHRERPEAHGGDLVLLPVHARRLLVGHLVDAVVRGGLRRRVVGDGAGAVVLGRAEHRGRGEVGHARDAITVDLHRLEHVRGAHHVDEGAPRGILTAERHLPGGEMDDARDLLLAHHADERILVGDVPAHHRHGLEGCVAHEHAHAPRVVAEVVHDGALAGGEEPLHHPRSDTAERARDQGRHRSKPPVWV